MFEKIINIGCNPFNKNSNRTDREKWSTSNGGPVFSKLFRLDSTVPLSFGPKFPEILVEWIAPIVILFMVKWHGLSHGRMLVSSEQWSARWHLSRFSSRFVNETETFSVRTSSAMRNGLKFETNATPIFEVKIEIVRFKLQMAGYVLYEPLS